MGFGKNLRRKGSLSVVRFIEMATNLASLSPGKFLGVLRMKTLNPDVRVILSSGYFGEEQAQEIMSQGARAFIQKPNGANDLARLVG